MTLPAVIESLWNNLQSARAPILDEVAGLSQAQADWRPTESDWSIGEILHHLTLAEVATGKLTSKLLKDAGETRSGFPAGLSALAALPPFPPGPREAPDPVRPGRGHAIGQLLADFQATRERSRQSVERLATIDPRALRWRHPTLGELDLGQWWQLQARHDGDHLQQIRALKANPGFPRR